jgi:hypothetical protein
MAQHSSIVGGSTAKRVIACPGSVALVATMPPRPSSKYADTGTLLHNAVSEIMEGRLTPEGALGLQYEDITLDENLMENKLLPALAALDEIDPDKKMEYACETVVGFGDVLPNVFGSADLLGRIGSTAYVIDYKFGDGVAVDVEENAQLLFYAAAAMRTKEVQWVFEGADKIECVIIQPPHIKRWQTTPRRVQLFEHELIRAVKRAQQPDAEFNSGDHCRWCAAKAVCPVLTGAADRQLRTAVQALNVNEIGEALNKADLLEKWIADVRALAHQMMDEGVTVPGYKLVPKRATRQWTDEATALDAMKKLGVKENELTETSVLSPAKAEKVLKKYKLALPTECVVSVSTGNTIAPLDDPRPAVLQIGKQLSAALGKLV